MSRPDRHQTLALLRRLRESPVGERLILAGSSGLHGVSETIPALTEDVDVLVDADWIASEGQELLDEMRRLGFAHRPGTCTFLLPGGFSLDLVGYSHRDTLDRIGGGAALPVMVFGDLSVLLQMPDVVRELPGGGRTLSPAALAASKLLTVRLEKGGKDKLQALLLVDENAGDPRFREELRRLLGRFERDRVEDALADAQAASIALSADALRADPEAGGYSEMAHAVERGLEVLQDLIGAGPEEP